MGESCPYCEKPGVENLNNHVRMSTDDAHGPAQTYPDDWDTGRQIRLTTDEGRQQTAEAADDDAGATGTDLDAETVGTDDGDDGEQDDAEAIQLDDDPADAREYECGECGEPVTFLEECDECGAELAWGAA